MLSSCDVPEWVTAIEWINHGKTSTPMLFAAGARNVKLFTIKDKFTKKHVTAKKSLAKGKGLVIPRSKVESQSKQCKHLATYRSCKEDRLHTVSLAPDNEHFITADEARVDLWNVERTADTVYSLVDYEKRGRDFTAEDERILSAKFNRNLGCSFLYTTSQGRINICDLR